MTILLQALEVRHERRIRLVFTNALASGAFGVPAPGGYLITCVDGSATPPGIQAALVVPGSATVVELSFDAPLVRGALYHITAQSIPAVDASSTATGTGQDFRWGFDTPPVNVEPARRNKELLLYGVDLIWNGVDYQENAAGDLDRVSGSANVTKALNHGVEANPGDLIWDETWGGGGREFVDSPSTAAGTLKGAVSAQLLRDPRVKSVKTTYEIDDEKTFLYATPTLISGEQIDRVSIEVPSDV